MRMILMVTPLSAANCRVFLGGSLQSLPARRLCLHDGCSWPTTSRLVSNTSRLFELLNKFGNSVVCDVFAVFPVKFYCNLATYIWRLLDQPVYTYGL
jgi:hypothetical protein